MNIRLLTIAAGVILIASCSSYKMTNSWKADNVVPQPYKNILVLGLINEPDRTIRENMETAIVAGLKDMGYKAICSCEEFGPKAFEDMKEKEALAKLNTNGIDAVLTVVLLDKRKERAYLPATIHQSPYSNYHSRFWGYYTTMYGRVYEPGYYVVNTKYFWESNFYSLQGGSSQLLYSVQSQSFDPPSTSVLTRHYAKMIIEGMVKENVLRNNREEMPRAF